MRHDPSWAHAGKIPVQGIGLAIPNGNSPRPAIGLSPSRTAMADPMKPGI
jgi:hypothetical protein